MDGFITQINISDGGVPKKSIACVVLTDNGLQGDRQANLKYYGGPDRAICLWSQDIIHQLQTEGHPIHAGSAGENITIQGLIWASLIPGTKLRLGQDVMLKITDYAAPCRKIMSCFIDRKFSRIDQNQFPGQSRLYAKVLTPGTIQTGVRVTCIQSH